jgi:hypothetical protein
MDRSLRALLTGFLALTLPACQEDQVLTAELTATCEARPSAGTAPLAVAFLVNVAGAEGPVSFSISYGDGQSGTNPDAAHTYATPGAYNVAFDVRTSTQSARCSTAVSVSPGTPPVGANQPPTAVFRTTPTAVGGFVTGTAPLTVGFNMCATSDPENDELYFGMDFEGDDKFDFKGITGFHCRADHVYAVGTWRPLICVHDRDKNFHPLHDDSCQRYTVVATP